MHKIYYLIKWFKIRNKVDAILCHYPKQKEDLRILGFKKMISVQTQVGIDTDVFLPDESIRKKIRFEKGWNDTVIGYAGRMLKYKGIYTLFDAAKNENWHIVYLGSGPEVKPLKKYISETEHLCKVEFIDKVPALEVGNYLNAFDIFYTGSITMPDWEDTFPNAVAQAQACRKPVIVSDSCALPYLAGDKSPIFKEGDAIDLHTKLKQLILEKDRQKFLAEYGYMRCHDLFSTRAINKQFYSLIKELTNEI